MYQYWGFSPALDLQDVAKRKAALDGGAAGGSGGDNADGGDGFHALVAGTYDFRHVARTLCRAWRHTDTCGGELCLVSWDVDASHTARHMLLLATLLDFALPRRERAELVLELHGSCFLRERAAAYAERRAKELLEVVAASAEGRELSTVLGRLLDLSKLKYRERDDIADCLRTWSRAVPFDMALAREHRQRKFFAERYDARHDVADWDYNMRLKDVAPIVRYQHFRSWRMGGVAYELRDARYEQPNRTLASMAAGRAVEQYDRTTGQPKGRSILKRGFWGDIITGPYAAFGVEADDERLYETSNKEQKHDERAVAEHNLLQMMCELEDAADYMPPNPDADADDAPPAPRAEGEAGGCTSADAGADAGGEEQGAQDVEPPAAAAAVLARAKVTFLMGDLPKICFAKRAYAGRFDAAALGCRDVHWPSHGLSKALKESGVVAVETGRYMVRQQRVRARQHRMRARAPCERHLTIPCAPPGRTRAGRRLEDRAQARPQGRVRGEAAGGCEGRGPRRRRSVRSHRRGCHALPTQVPSAGRVSGQRA